MGARKHFSFISRINANQTLNEVTQPISLGAYFQSIHRKEEDHKIKYSCTVMGYALAILEVTDELKLTSSSCSGIMRFFNPHVESEWDSVRKRKSDYLKILREYGSNNTTRVERISTKTLLQVKSLFKKLCLDKSIRAQEYLKELFLDRGEDDLVS